MGVWRAQTALLPESRDAFEELAAAKRFLREEIRSAGGTHAVVRLAWDDLQIFAEYELDAPGVDEPFERAEEIIRRVADGLPGPVTWKSLGVGPIG